MLDGFSVLDDVVRHLSKLPGIGEKTATRYALWMVEHKEDALLLSNALKSAADEIKLCKLCRNLTRNADGVCELCKDTTRDNSVICVVESFENFLAIESSSVYNGTYYILGGLVSPLYGIDLYRLGLDYLVKRVIEESINEVILVVSSTLEGDLTTQYIKESLKNSKVKITKIASGVPLGTSINFVDKSTLIEAFKGRHAV